jgi:mevalonate kinase
MRQYFYGHGKLLITGEYLVLKGAEALALPTILGQSMAVHYRQSHSPKLTWKSFDHKGELWFEAEFEPWQFDLIEKSVGDQKVVDFLQSLLKETRGLNPHFLRESQEVEVETRVEFPLDWGLGSSSTLIHNVAQWAYISPFELSRRTMPGSGFDIACAQTKFPLIYQLKASKAKAPEASWKYVSFNPSFKEQLFFLHQNRKACSQQAVHSFNDKHFESSALNISIKKLNSITNQLTDRSITLDQFMVLLWEHETILSELLGMTRLQTEKFADFDGVIKSLGAWGGDFALVASKLDPEEIKRYFASKDHHTLIPYDDLASQAEMNQSYRGPDGAHDTIESDQGIYGV